MGVYLPNVDMPENCGKCSFAVDGWCSAYGKPNLDAVENDVRANFCPLVPVPPHGRLIDADALINSIKMQTGFCKLLGGNLATAGEVIEKGFLQEIANAPTIIPAEPGEEETT